jgi:hypothetical protein
MSFLTYYVSYFFSWSALMSLGLSIFQFRLNQHYYQIIISALLLSYVSANIQYYDKGYLTAIVQPICAILCLRLIFRIHWFQSAVIIVCTYAVNILAEFCITYMISFFKFKETIQALQSNDVLLIGIGIILFNVLACALLTKFRWGFSFISSRSTKTFQTQGDNNTKFITLILLGLALIAGSGIIIYFFENYILLKNVLLIVNWLSLLRLAYLKEVTEQRASCRPCLSWL